MELVTLSSACSSLEWPHIGNVLALEEFQVADSRAGGAKLRKQGSGLLVKTRTGSSGGFLTKCVCFFISFGPQLKIQSRSVSSTCEGNAFLSLVQLRFQLPWGQLRKVFSLHCVGPGDRALRFAARSLLTEPSCQPCCYVFLWMLDIKGHYLLNLHHPSKDFHGSLG